MRIAATYIASWTYWSLRFKASVRHYGSEIGNIIIIRKVHYTINQNHTIIRVKSYTTSSEAQQCATAWYTSTNHITDLYHMDGQKYIKWLEMSKWSHDSCLQRFQSGLKSEESWIRVKKFDISRKIHPKIFDFFQANFPKISDFCQILRGSQPPTSPGLTPVAACVQSLCRSIPGVGTVSLWCL